MASPEKVFTVDEANQLLPRIIPLVNQLRGLQQSIAKTTGELETDVKKLSVGNGYPLREVREHVEQLTQHQLNLLKAFESALQQLEALGAVLKDLTLGLVDFYSLRDGDLVWLCWKMGEDRIRFWHALDEGIAGRHPLE